LLKWQIAVITTSTVYFISKMPVYFADGFRRVEASIKLKIISNPLVFGNHLIKPNSGELAEATWRR
jgi:hypothetical protein